MRTQHGAEPQRQSEQSMDCSGTANGRVRYVEAEVVVKK